MFSKLILGVLILVAIVFIVIVVFLFYKAELSKQSPVSENHLSLGLSQLKPCSDKPNCVCSEHPQRTQHFIEPMPYEENDVEIMKKINAAVTDMQGKVIHQSENYLAVEHRTPLFGFVDDVEIRLDSENKLIHFRSASRQGYSDFEKNRQRINALKQYIQ